jgi:hypothetical protein
VIGDQIVDLRRVVLLVQAGLVLHIVAGSFLEFEQEEDVGGFDFVEVELVKVELFYDLLCVNHCVGLGGRLLEVVEGACWGQCEWG